MLPQTKIIKHHHIDPLKPFKGGGATCELFTRNFGMRQPGGGGRGWGGDKKLIKQL